MAASPLRHAEILWEAPGQPRSRDFDDIYYSHAGGAGEARHVFLGGNGLPARWAACREFAIAETGFGAGLNFAVTRAAWSKCAPRSALLAYIAIEGFPLRASDAARAFETWPELSDSAAELLADWPTLAIAENHRRFDEGRVRLTVLHAELADALPLLPALLPPHGVDAWYLHGFAPAKNPEMWTAGLYRAMATLTARDGTFATFTTAAVVRSGLAAAGFRVTKARGFAAKRHMLQGTQGEPGVTSNPD